MPSDLSQMTTEELLAGYKSAQAREQGPPRPPAEEVNPWEHAKGLLSQPLGDQAKAVWSKMWQRNPNAFGDEMGSAALFFPKGTGLLAGGAAETAEVAPEVDAALKVSRAGPINNLPPPGSPLFESVASTPAAAATQAPAAAAAETAAPGLLSRASGFLKSKLGQAAGGYALVEAAKGGGKWLMDHKGEIADKALTLGAGLLPEETASRVSQWATGADPNDLKQKTNDELLRGYREALAREGGKAP